MPITYENTRITSAKATDLMARINALESVVGADRYQETNTVIVGPASYIGTLITCDRSGALYAASNNGTTSGVSRRISKYEYDGTVIDEDFILYGAGATGDGTISQVLAIDADENSLWVVNYISGTESSLKKFDLDTGAEVSEIKRSPTTTATPATAASYSDVQILPDGSVACIYGEEAGSFGTSEETKSVFVYTGGVGTESVVYSYTQSPRLLPRTFITNLCANDAGNLIFTVRLNSGNPVAYRYSTGGALLDTIPKSGTGTPSNPQGFNYPFHCFVGDLVMAGSGSTLFDEGIYQQNGDYVEDVSIDSSNDQKDCTEDENYNLYFTTFGASGTIKKKLYSGGFLDQSEFYRYPDAGAKTNPESLGTPDGGVTIPASGALQYLTNGTRHRPHYGTLEDMRVAIETVAPYYLNALTGNPYNTTLEDPDNIFGIAILSYDWTTPGEVPKQMMRATDFSDMDLVLTELEGASLA
jgi:hypothetical protein